MKFFVINGPSLNMLGIREVEKYGKQSYEDLLSLMREYAHKKGVELSFLQSNHEGELVDFIQRAYFEGADGIVINPAAYTHTSVALLDAVLATSLPTVEVHITDPTAREEFRRISYIRAACIDTVSGHGFQGYLEALDLLIAHCEAKP